MFGSGDEMWMEKWRESENVQSLFLSRWWKKETFKCLNVKVLLHAPKRLKRRQVSLSSLLSFKKWWSIEKLFLNYNSQPIFLSHARHIFSINAIPVEEMHFFNTLVWTDVWSALYNCASTFHRFNAGWEMCIDLNRC